MESEQTVATAAEMEQTTHDRGSFIRNPPPGLVIWKQKPALTHLLCRCPFENVS